ncbi:MAG: hypothetical protein M1833_005824 [Piccolia ochrophora]|nr:MAG: hypothetical protein M1833_005824 [Piccolia ochrophora]
MTRSLSPFYLSTRPSYRPIIRRRHQRSCCSIRLFQTSRSNTSSRTPDFAFAFDIDGVLLRSSKPIAGAQKTLRYLQQHRIPFILLTNGGGKHELDRVAELSDKLGVPLDVSMFVQSHTPFAELVADNSVSGGLRDKSILVVGGDGDKCRKVAEAYGFTNVVTPGDIFAAHPSIWPFSEVFHSYYKSFARPLPAPISPSSTPSLQIDSIFVYNDPRDWALDAQIILDLLLSSRGILGSVSSKNNDPSLPNRGFQQDCQPPLYYSNPDLWWAAEYHLPRLGQGGFREALEGLWAAVTGGPARGVQLHKKIIGKPYHETYAFAERRLSAHRKTLFGTRDIPSLQTVYMVGDNPESDIRGANEFRSPSGSAWSSVLVRSGVFVGGEPSWKPKVIVDDVWQAMNWALKASRWDAPD